MRSIDGNPYAESFALYEVQGEKSHRVTVVTRSGPRMALHDNRRCGRGPRWTPRGLLVASSNGLVLVNGNTRTPIIDKYAIDTNRRLDVPTYFLSPDGSRGVAGLDETLTVFAVVEPATTRTVPIGTLARAPSIIAAGFPADGVWVLVNNGRLLRIEVGGALSVHKKLGPPSELKEGFLQNGKREDVHYDAALAPNGGYLSLLRPGRVRTIYRLP